jgi:CDP-4-dehydro-6-deoxyglucose reductase, E3
MPQIHYAGSEYALAPGESVLDCLLRHQAVVSYSCKSGVCQSCLMKGTRGRIPERAQAGIKDTLRSQGYFLACSCEPDEDLAISQPGDEQRVPARITSVEALTPRVLRVRLAPEQPFEYRAGQYISLFREDGLARSYSVASLPEEAELELHVRLVDGGAMSEWLRHTLPGRAVSIQGPMGNCFYVAGNPEEPLLLAGTGTGLAPLCGIVRDALAQGHTGPVWLFHGAVEPGGLYLDPELLALAAQHPNLRYVRSVLRDACNDIDAGTLDGAIFTRLPQLKDWKTYVCGDPDFVRGLRKKIFLAGAASRSIYADAFIRSAP